MRKFILTLLSVVGLIAIATPEAGAVKREHRAVWMSAYTSDWPKPSDSAERQKQQLYEDLDSMSRNNMTTVYYHARVMCDALYDSKYEPWSNLVTGTRGNAPSYDPMALIVEESHKRGIELYAWLNPYRYYDSTVGSSWGSAGGDKNYENSHPEWLITYTFVNKIGSEETWTILNPALEEVKQRIVDVVADIIAKYDVDGIVFDDYFYQNGLPQSYDQSFYQKYADAETAAGRQPMTHKDWRRENVNDMVRRVNAYIKQTKPWVRFGIGPAGVAAGDKSVADKYGIEPCPGSDWQYNGIASEPVAWLKEGTIDFISPQVYWTIGNANADYAAITPWWYRVAKKFNRHCFISQDISANLGNLSNVKRNLQEFVDEVDLNRASALDNAPGAVYFPWNILRSTGKWVNNKVLKLSNYLRYNVYQHKSLSPAVKWVKAENPGTVAGLRRDGRKLSWTGFDNVRYAVYAVPADRMATFQKEEEFLLGVSYTGAFEIPNVAKGYPGYGIADQDIDKFSYAVAVLDRLGNEYNAVFVGATVTAAEKPVLTAPANGTQMPWRFTFRWTGNSSFYEVAVATDAAMKNLVYCEEVAGNELKSSEVCEFEAGKDYFWQVRTRGNNQTEVVSDVAKFSVDVFRILEPANGATGCSFAPAFSWSDLGAGTRYVLEISSDEHFNKEVFRHETTETRLTLPQFVLAGNVRYYARVAMAEGDALVYGQPISFTTKAPDLSAPTIESPATNGEVLHSNQSVRVAGREGIVGTRIMISASETFPARSSYSETMDLGTFAGKELSQVKILSKPLSDGKTYYVRSLFNYYDEAGASKSTEWSETRSFVYDSEAGVASLETEDVRLVGGAAPYLSVGEAGLRVAVYAADGTLVAELMTDGNGCASLSHLEAGAYVVAVEKGGALRSLKFVR